MGKFEKGNQHGAKSKRGKDLVKQKVKQYLTQFVDEYLITKLKEDFEEITPKERLDIITKLMPYIMPKLNSSDVKVDASEKVIEIVHIDANKEK